MGGAPPLELLLQLKPKQKRAIAVRGSLWSPIGAFHGNNQTIALFQGLTAAAG